MTEQSIGRWMPVLTVVAIVAVCLGLVGTWRHSGRDMSELVKSGLGVEAEYAAGAIGAAPPGTQTAAILAHNRTAIASVR